MKSTMGVKMEKDCTMYKLKGWSLARVKEPTS